jgi:hypothetical protein
MSKHDTAPNLFGERILGRVRQHSAPENSIPPLNFKPGRRPDTLDGRRPDAMLSLTALHHRGFEGRPAGVPRLAKLIGVGADPKEIENYEGACFFRGRGLDVSSPERLLNAIEFLQSQHSTCVVFGAPTDDADLANMRRLIYDTPGVRNPARIWKATIVDKPAWWLAIDIDDLRVPLGVHGLRGIAEYARTRLPIEFRGAWCVAAATGSYGLKPGARLRFFFLLDAPLTCAQKVCWLGKAPFIDRSIYTPNQVIYTSRPVFAGNPEFDDPMFGVPRVITLDGEPHVRTPHPERLKPPRYPAAFTPRGTAGVDDHSLILSAMIAIDSVEPGGRHNRIMREAFNLATLAVAGGVDPDRALRGLIRAGTKTMPGAREIKPDEIVRQWKHALAVKAAEWSNEQKRDPSTYDEEDLS